MKLFNHFSKFERMPTVPILGYNALKDTNVKTMECLLDPEKHVKLVKFIQRELEPDAVLPLLDLTVEAQTMGAEVVYPEYDAPRIEGTIEPKNMVAQTKTKNRITTMVETVEKLKKSISDTPMGFYVTGPFTVAGQIVGIDKLVKNMIRDPEAVISLLETITPKCLTYAKELEEAGVDFLVIPEPSSSLISAEQFKKFSQPYLRRVISSVKLDTVLHICGRSGHLIRLLPETKAAGISIDHNVPMTKAVSEVPRDTLVFGNYPPSNLVFEDISTIRINVARMLMEVKDHENVISSTGCDIPSNVPMINIEAFIKASKEIKNQY